MPTPYFQYGMHQARQGTFALRSSEIAGAPDFVPILHSVPEAQFSCILSNFPLRKGLATDSTLDVANLFSLWSISSAGDF